MALAPGFGGLLDDSGPAPHWPQNRAVADNEPPQRAHTGPSDGLLGAAPLGVLPFGGADWGAPGDTTGVGGTTEAGGAGVRWNWGRAMCALISGGS